MLISEVEQRLAQWRQCIGDVEVEVSVDWNVAPTSDPGDLYASKSDEWTDGRLPMRWILIKAQPFRDRLHAEVVAYERDHPELRKAVSR